MRVALCQIEVEDDPRANLAAAGRALEQCPDADLAIFPEAMLTRFGNDLNSLAQPVDGPFVTGLRERAREAGTAVIAGIFEPSDHGKVYNTAVAIDAGGGLVSTYRKIHLFDAFSFAESDDVSAGNEPAIVDIAGTRIGLVTCYDLRFPELFRALVDRGAEAFVIIAAWAQGTFKEEHWMTLVRARAIENTMWTVAVDKAGDQTKPPSGARTGIGRSIVVDPMGAVRVDLGMFPSVETYEIDMGLTDTVRKILPSLSHRVLR
ncbi:MAG TPA: carbon-nitrogen hydrolase family protein [Candidatus Stackebrandtia faecavium]|nr:carbon-nitrogen hydrolase family protein [Candidatus Stackebrandtia faecavium]